MMGTPKHKGVSVELGGVVYIIPPLTLGRLSFFRDRLEAIGDNINPMDPVFQSLAIDVIHAAVVRNYPDMSRDDLAELVDLGTMSDAWMACLDVSGIRRKEQEAAAQGEPAAATGTI